MTPRWETLTLTVSLFFVYMYFCHHVNVVKKQTYLQSYRSQLTCGHVSLVGHDVCVYVGQSKAVLFLKREEKIRAAFISHNKLNMMTSPVFVLYLTCLFMGKMGELRFCVFKSVMFTPHRNDCNILNVLITLLSQLFKHFTSSLISLQLRQLL